MRVLVTGGAGFIGSHIVELLLEHGHDVAVIDNLSTGKEENVPKGARLYPVDLTSWRIQEVLAAERPEVIIHQAAQIDVRRSVENPAMDALRQHHREYQPARARTGIWGPKGGLRLFGRCVRQSPVGACGRGSSYLGDVALRRFQVRGRKIPLRLPGAVWDRFHGPPLCQRLWPPAGSFGERGAWLPSLPTGWPRGFR